MITANDDRPVTIDDEQVNNIERYCTHKAGLLEEVAAGMAELRERRRLVAIAVDWKNIEYHFGPRDSPDQTITTYIKMILRKEYDKGIKTATMASATQIEIALSQIRKNIT